MVLDVESELVFFGRPTYSLSLPSFLSEGRFLAGSHFHVSPVVFLHCVGRYRSQDIFYSNSTHQGLCNGPQRVKLQEDSQNEFPFSVVQTPSDEVCIPVSG